MPELMRRVVVESIDEIRVDRVPVPEPGPREALVRSRAVGICGSDLHAAEGSHPFISLPYRPGHEVVGVVESIGASVTRVRPGDRVVVEPNLSCGSCRQCRSGAYNVCRELMVFGCQTPGGMADAFTIDEDRLHVLPPELSDVDAALVEPLATPVHAVRAAGDVRGKRVAVLGAGPIGLLTVVAARHAGASPIAVTDLVADKRNRAIGFGASAAFPADEPDLPSRCRDSLGGPADVVFDCVARESSMAVATDLVDKGGTIVVVGVAAGPTRIRLDLLQDKEIRVLGSLMYVRRDMLDALALLASGAVRASQLVTASFPLDDAARAFAAAREPGQVKVLITVDARASGGGAG